MRLLSLLHRPRHYSEPPMEAGPTAQIFFARQQTLYPIVSESHFKLLKVLMGYFCLLTLDY